MQPLSSLPADSPGGDRRTNQQGWRHQQRGGVVLNGQLAEVRAQGRLEGTPRLLGDSQEARPHPAPGIPRPCACPEAVRENLIRPAAALLKQQEEDGLPSGTFSLGSVAAGQFFPFSGLQSLLFCRRKGVRADGSRTFPDLNSLNLWHFLTKGLAGRGRG